MTLAAACPLDTNMIPGGNLVYLGLGGKKVVHISLFLSTLTTSDLPFSPSPLPTIRFCDLLEFVECVSRPFWFLASPLRSQVKF